MIGFPGAVIQPSPNYSEGRRDALDQVVLHTTEGDLASSLNTLTDPARQIVDENGQIQNARVSAHYVVTGNTIYQLVSDDNEAWHAIGHNAHTIGVEVVGEAHDPRTWSDAVVTQLSRLVAWLSLEYGIPLEYRAKGEPDIARGFVAHGALDPDRRHDPGIWFPWTQVKSAALRIQSGAAPMSADGAGVVALLIIAIGLAWALR
jgi:N-acetyl-anhydromuramyl-L-alanine amidase AmpD